MILRNGLCELLACFYLRQFPPREQTSDIVPPSCTARNCSFARDGVLPEGSVLGVTGEGEGGYAPRVGVCLLASLNEGVTRFRCHCGNETPAHGASWRSARGRGWRAADLEATRRD